jgi:hypothetical protein
MRGDQNQKQRFENTSTGCRVVTPVGTGTGERGDIVVVDDPTSVDQAESDTERKAANEWWSGTMSTRVNDLRAGHRVVIQQRLHEDDLTGYLLERGGYELLMLAEEFEPERACSTSIGWNDLRTEAGQLLWPERIGNQELETIKRDLGSYRYAGQYQQRPSPAGGGIYKRWWWRYWKPRASSFRQCRFDWPMAVGNRLMPSSCRRSSTSSGSPGTWRSRTWILRITWWVKCGVPAVRIGSYWISGGSG